MSRAGSMPRLRSAAPTAQSTGPRQIRRPLSTAPAVGIHCASGRPRATRPRDAKSAASHTDIAAILSWPEAAARLITFRAPTANSASASMNQIHTCVSNSSERGSDVPFIAGPPRVLDWTDDVPANLGRPCHVTKEISRFFLHRHQLGDGFAALGDDDRSALLCHRVHQSQTVRLEFRSSNVPVVHNSL